MKDVKDEAGEKKEKPKSESGSESGDKKDKDEEEEDEEDDRYKGIEKTRLQIVVDPVSLEYIQLFKDCQSEEANAEEETRRAARKEALDAAVHDLFYPPASVTETADGDAKMADAGALAGEGVEVVNIPIAQEDELADIPAEMREIVASEIASFRERSNRRDAERLKREQELEEQELRRNGEASDRSRAANGSKSSAALPRGAEAAKNVDFVNGGSSANGHGHGRRRDFEREDSVDTDASDEELYEREIRQRLADEDAQFKEAERKWTMRERQRAAALEREKERDRTEAERTERHQNEQLERDQTWDDEREASRKSTLYYRDRAAWLRKRGHDRAEEELRDTSDRRAERDQQRREAAEMETAKGMADSFLDQQAEGMMDERVRRGEGEEGKGGRTGKDGHLATGAAPQKVTISFGAAAQRAQAQRGGAMRRTVAEVEGLLDDEEQEASTKKRQLVPINFEPMAASASMTDEEINQAVRALAQEIPTERDGLWAWTVQWDSLDESVIRDKLRPFVEKKVVEYLGVQEQFLVEVVEEHLRKHGKPEALVEELQEALDEAEDLVKKLWRMVIFFSESEKRGLPA